MLGPSAVGGRVKLTALPKTIGIDVRIMSLILTLVTSASIKKDGCIGPVQGGNLQRYGHHATFVLRQYA